MNWTHQSEEARAEGGAMRPVRRGWEEGVG